MDIHEYYISIGGSGEWRPVTPKETIEFKPMDLFLRIIFKDANHFEILDSVTAKFQPVLQDYFDEISIDTVAGELHCPIIVLKVGINLKIYFLLGSFNDSDHFL